MQKNALVRVKNIVLYSPFFLLIFLVIPVLTILNLKLHLRVSGDLLLSNNIAFGAILLLRLVTYAVNLRRGIRYGAERGVPAKGLAVDRSASELKGELEGAGYRFATDGRYGERRDLGYIGTTLIYCGLFLLLAFGSWDYMREYSIMVRMGVGEPLPLDGKGLVGDFEAGIWADAEDLPKLKIVNQILPNAQWPRGATEIALISEDNQVLKKGTISPDKPLTYSGLDFYMSKFLFDAVITISTGNFLVYDGFIKFFPLAQKHGDYSYKAKFTDPDTGKLKGLAWLRPEKKAVKVEATLEGKKIVDTELELWGQHKKVVGDYTASLEGIAHWTEIRVARARHGLLIWLGGILALIGAGLRLAIRPQRVWLEEENGRSLVKVRGGKALQIVGKA